MPPNNVRSSSEKTRELNSARGIDGTQTTSIFVQKAKNPNHLQETNNMGRYENQQIVGARASSAVQTAHPCKMRNWSFSLRPSQVSGGSNTREAAWKESTQFGKDRYQHKCRNRSRSILFQGAVRCDPLASESVGLVGEVFVQLADL
ncbi:hypothetical protein O6H91_Y221900 [Diphasiastrum complanatum]|nr:hypothetical protein O6H91_Y221900 [Diphasiastrum complanatum]